MNPVAGEERLSRPDAIDGLYATACWLLRRGRYREAAAVARALVRVSWADERGWLVLGVCHESIEQPEMAAEMYGVGAALARPAPRCELARARILGTLGQPAECVEAYQRAAAAALDVGDEGLQRLIEEERTRP